MSDVHTVKGQTMKKLLFAALLLLPSYIYAQDLTDQINKDVWFNFMQAYQDLDASLFNKIHTEDVLRVSQDNGNMLIGQEYKDRNLENFNRWNLAKLKQKIAFSFYSRTQKGKYAYETGIYKLTRFGPDGPRSFYGKFHVTLRKENGFWKIMIDSDSNENGSIDEAAFQKGEQLEFF